MSYMYYLSEVCAFMHACVYMERVCAFMHVCVYMETELVLTVHALDVM